MNQTTGVDPGAHGGAQIALDARTRALFISDLHLGDGSRTDLFGEQDEALIGFIERWRHQVDTIVFLGDVLDMPQAWSLPRIRAAHPECWRYLAGLSRQEHVLFVRGNHDWTVDYPSLFPGAILCDAVLIGERALAWHGHQVDVVLNPDADALLQTYIHHLVERIVGRRLVPPLTSYPSLANRLALGGTIGWAKLLAARARRLHAAGQSAHAAPIEARLRYLARSFMGDPAGILGASVEKVLGEEEHAFDVVLCGHSHVPGVVRTPRGVYANTGTWTSGHRTYGRWDGERFLILHADTDEELGDELYAELAESFEPEDLFRWWDANKGGVLEYL